jgi:hypothetical protein
MDKKKIAAFLSGDVDEWVGWMRENGLTLSDDPKVVEGQFHLARLQCLDVPVPVRLQSRKILIDKNVVKKIDYPITPTELLNTNPRATPVTSGEVKNLVGMAKEIALCYPSELSRNKHFMKVLNQLQGTIDNTHSSVRHFEIYTLGQTRIKFLVENDTYVMPDKDIVYRIYTNVI